MKLKIISGGQTGADLAGLWVGKLFGLETGGIAPLGFKTLLGNQPALKTIFELRESPKSDYRTRTVQNVKSGDVTLVFSRNMSSRGTVLTINTCEKLTKSCFKIPDLRDRNLESPEAYWALAKTDERFEAWRRAQGAIRTFARVDGFGRSKGCIINVAGNAHKNSPDAFEFAFVGLWMLLVELGLPAPAGDAHVLASQLKDLFEMPN